MNNQYKEKLSAITREDIQTLISKIKINKRFFSNNAFSNLRDYAIHCYMRDSLGNTPLKAAILHTNDYNIINKAYIRNRMGYEHARNDKQIKKQNMYQKDFEDTLKLAKERNNKKLYRALDNSCSVWHALQEKKPQITGIFDNIFAYTGLKTFEGKRIFFKNKK